MKGNEITQEDIKEWNRKGQIPALCRICGKITLYPKKFYTPEELKNYECINCKKIKRLFGL